MSHTLAIVLFAAVVLLAGQADAINCVGDGLDPDYISRVRIWECNDPTDRYCAEHDDELELDYQFGVSSRVWTVTTPQELTRIWVEIEWGEHENRLPQCNINVDNDDTQIPNTPSNVGNQAENGGSANFLANPDADPFAGQSGAFPNILNYHANSTVLTGALIGEVPSGTVNTFRLYCFTIDDTADGGPSGTGVLDPCNETVYDIRFSRLETPCPAYPNTVPQTPGVDGVPGNLLQNLTVHLVNSGVMEELGTGGDELKFAPCPGGNCATALNPNFDHEATNPAVRNYAVTVPSKFNNIWLQLEYDDLLDSHVGKYGDVQMSPFTTAVKVDDFYLEDTVNDEGAPVYVPNLLALDYGLQIWELKVWAYPFCAPQTYYLSITREYPTYPPGDDVDCPIPNNQLLGNLTITNNGAATGVELGLPNPGFQGTPNVANNGNNGNLPVTPYVVNVGRDISTVTFKVFVNSAVINPIFTVDNQVIEPDENYRFDDEQFIQNRTVAVKYAEFTLILNEIETGPVLQDRETYEGGNPYSSSVTTIQFTLASDNCYNATYQFDVHRNDLPHVDPDTVTPEGRLPSPTGSTVKFVTGDLPGKRRFTDQQLIRALIANNLAAPVSTIDVNRYFPEVDLTVAVEANTFLGISALDMAEKLVAIGEDVNPGFWDNTLLQGVVWRIVTVFVQGPAINIQQGPKDDGPPADESSPSSASFTVAPQAPEDAISYSEQLPIIGDIPSNYFVDPPSVIGQGIIYNIPTRVISGASSITFSFLAVVLTMLVTIWFQ